MKHSVKTSSFTVIVGFLCVAMIGAALLPLLPVRLYPSKSSPMLTVHYSLPGSSARVVEIEVTAKLEAMLARMKGIRNIDSRSRNGSGTIWIQVDKHTDVERLRFEATSVIRQVWPDLPEGLSYPQVVVNSPDERARSPFLTYTLNAGVPPAQLQQYAESYLQPAVARLQGVYEMTVSGATPMEWQLRYDPHQLEVLRLSPSTLSNAISAYFSSEYAGMAYVKPTGWHRIAVVPQAGVCEHFPAHRIVVQNREGRLLRLSELVEVSHVEAAAQSYYRINGLNSIYLSVTADETANQLTLGKQVHEVMNGLAASLPAGYSLATSYDATEHLQKELDNIYFRSALTVFFLLLFVLLITRRWRYLVLVTVSLTVNLLVAVVLYYLLGIEMQLYTLAGITISLNLIIDNTIVMTDHLLHRHNLRAYLSILAATLTTICALGVVLFLDERLKADLADFAVVVIINLAVSLLIALSFVPSLIDKLGMVQASRRSRRQLRLSLRMGRLYEVVVGFLSRHKVLACGVLVLLFGIPIFLLPERMNDDEGWHGLYNRTIGSTYYKENIRPTVDKVLGGTWRLFVEEVYNGSYFTSKEETVLHVNATLPNGSTLEQMNHLVMQMESYLGSFKEIKQFRTTVSSPYEASIEIYFPAEHQHSSFPYTLKSNITTRAIQLGGGSWSVYGLDDQGFNNSVQETAGSYRIRMVGYNYDELYAHAETMRDSLLRHRRIREVHIGSDFHWYKENYREFLFQVNPDRLAEANLTPMELYQSMKAHFERNLYCTSVRGSAGGYEQVRLLSNTAYAYDTWQLEQMALQSGNKEFKLYSLAQVGMGEQASEVVKNNQQYMLCLQYEYVGAQQSGRKIMEQEIAHFKAALPPGYDVWSETSWGYWNSDDNSQYGLLLLVAIVIFFVTGILFNSLRQPFAILFVIPISYIGVFVTFWLFELNFDQGGFAAFILLCGITVNAGIYLVDEYKHILSVDHRRDTRFCRLAWIRACHRKIVPILLTVCSTILGFIPFMIGSEKEPFWFPLAAGVIGGLVMSLIGIFIYLPLFALPKQK